MLRQYAVVEFTPEYREWSRTRDTSGSPDTAAFFLCESFWYLGVIPNYPQNCLVVDRETRRIFEGHPEIFQERVYESVNNHHYDCQARKANLSHCIYDKACHI